MVLSINRLTMYFTQGQVQILERYFASVEVFDGEL